MVGARRSLRPLGPARSERASTRGPGWQRGATERFNPEPQRVIEARATAVSLGNKGRDDLTLGQRVFHGKFGYGTIEAIEGNKLEILFEKAGRKKVLDSFVSAESIPLENVPQLGYTLFTWLIVSNASRAHRPGYQGSG